MAQTTVSIRMDDTLKKNMEEENEMHKIILPIDTKSLYYNVLNDNIKGHTCTVATPIKQGKSINPLLREVYRIPEQIDFEKHEDLIKELTKNSKSIVKINNVFVFEKLKVNEITEFFNIIDKFIEECLLKLETVPIIHPTIDSTI